MNIPNLYEQLVFDSIGAARLQVFIPCKDKGVDAVVTDGSSKSMRIQVKGSKGFGQYHNGWYVINSDKLIKSENLTDLWVFVWLEPGKKGGGFSPHFLAISPSQLSNRLKTYSSVDIKNNYHIYFGRPLAHFPTEVIDFRKMAAKDLKTLTNENICSSRFYTNHIVGDWEKSYQTVTGG